jgi:hypothetical protein
VFHSKRFLHAKEAYQKNEESLKNSRLSPPAPYQHLFNCHSTQNRAIADQPSVFKAAGFIDTQK